MGLSRIGLTSLAFFLAFAASALADGIEGAPAPFDKGGVKVALVNYFSVGDTFQRYEAGVGRQAKALGIELRVFPGQQDAALQREQIEQAINLGVDGIIVNHGQPESLKDVVQKALDAGIKIVAYNVALDNGAIPQIEQSDRDLAGAVLDQAVADNGASFTAGFVFVAGYPDMDIRGDVWEELKKKHPGIVEKARWGSVDDSTVTTVAAQTAAALRANPDIRIIYAPWDEFARGVKLGAAEIGVTDQIKIYSADVTTSDIQEIREEGSPWVATASADPAVIGEVSVRAIALRIANQDTDHVISIKPALVTRADLDKHDIKTIEELNAKLPAFGKSDAATAPWIPFPVDGTQ